MSIIFKSLSVKKRLYCCFVDYTIKAFDSVQRVMLWYKLYHIGVRCKLLQVIKSMYSNITTCVQVDGFNYFTNELGLRDRPFNLKGGRGVMVFCFVQKNFFGQNKLEYYFLSPKARNFFQEFNIRLYDKNSESNYFFFPPPKSEYFFQQHWESEYFFRKKT